MANIVHDSANDPEVIKKVIRSLFKMSGPNGIDEDKLRAMYRNQGYDMGMIEDIISEVISEPGMKIKKGIK